MLRLMQPYHGEGFPSSAVLQAPNLMLDSAQAVPSQDRIAVIQLQLQPWLYHRPMHLKAHEAAFLVTDCIEDHKGILWTATWKKDEINWLGPGFLKVGNPSCECAEPLQEAHPPQYEQRHSRLRLKEEWFPLPKNKEEFSLDRIEDKWNKAQEG